MVVAPALTESEKQASSQEPAPANLQEGVTNDVQAEPTAPVEVRLQAAGGETQKKATRTIMLYLCGSNLETYSGMATYNLKQILSSSFSANEQTRFLVMTGGRRGQGAYRQGHHAGTRA